MYKILKLQKFSPAPRNVQTGFKRSTLARRPNFHVQFRRATHPQKICLPWQEIRIQIWAATGRTRSDYAWKLAAHDISSSPVRLCTISKAQHSRRLVLIQMFWQSDFPGPDATMISVSRSCFETNPIRKRNICERTCMTTQRECSSFGSFLETKEIQRFLSIIPCIQHVVGGKVTSGTFCSVISSPKEQTWIGTWSSNHAALRKIPPNLTHECAWLTFDSHNDFRSREQRRQNVHSQTQDCVAEFNGALRASGFLIDITFWIVSLLITFLQSIK